MTIARRIAAALVVCIAFAACSSDDDAGESAGAELGFEELSDEEVEVLLGELDLLSDDDYLEALDEWGLTEAEVESLYEQLSTEDDSTTGAAPGGATRVDIGCDDETLGADELITFSTAHLVVGGQLGEVCRGDESETLQSAWKILETIAPTEQLTELAVFSGFESGEDSDEITLAFVEALDDDGSVFQMSINLTEADGAGGELGLTLAHEISHVFNGVSTQVDRSAESIDDCATYFNGDGCYTDDSLMWGWIREFWDDGLIGEIDPLDEATAADGQDRCDRNPGFFGAYAASNPEEDFAETFSAFVFAVRPESDAQRDKLDWMATQPGLAEFRARAAAAGLAPVDYQFDRCG